MTRTPLFTVAARKPNQEAGGQTQDLRGINGKHVLMALPEKMTPHSIIGPAPLDIESNTKHQPLYTGFLADSGNALSIGSNKRTWF